MNEKKVFWSLRGRFTLAQEPTSTKGTLEEAIKEWHRLGGKSRAYTDKDGKPDELVIVPIINDVIEWKMAIIPQKKKGEVFR